MTLISLTNSGEKANCGLTAEKQNFSRLVNWLLTAFEQNLTLISSTNTGG